MDAPVMYRAAPRGSVTQQFDQLIAQMDTIDLTGVAAPPGIGKPGPDMVVFGTVCDDLKRVCVTSMRIETEALALKSEFAEIVSNLAKELGFAPDISHAMLVITDRRFRTPRMDKIKATLNEKRMLTNMLERHFWSQVSVQIPEVRWCSMPILFSHWRIGGKGSRNGGSLNDAIVHGFIADVISGAEPFPRPSPSDLNG